MSGEGGSDAEALRLWITRLEEFISSLDGVEGDDPFDFIENAMDAWQGDLSPETAPPPTSPAMLIIVETSVRLTTPSTFMSYNQLLGPKWLYRAVTSAVSVVPDESTSARCSNRSV